MGVFKLELLYGSKSIWHQTSVLLVNMKAIFLSKELYMHVLENGYLGCGSCGFV